MKMKRTIKSDVEKSVAPLELLLSVAESRMERNNVQAAPSEHSNGTKAVIQNGCIHLFHENHTAEEIVMRYNVRNVYSALFSDYSGERSRYLELNWNRLSLFNAGESVDKKGGELAQSTLERLKTVSYTHLTLPTNREV
eukprot:TRINITY_DN1981_c0_g1_i20.p1 TRINITY_DN1981_c0_g1~~TRINITY_DN1981_c0_g1_i20.p1  ORF type:complete len:139 (-),score=30.22 TRINITY_DN1981_c0_g1_i20:39-455(-)